MLKTLGKNTCLAFYVVLPHWYFCTLTAALYDTFLNYCILTKTSSFFHVLHFKTVTTKEQFKGKGMKTLWQRSAAFLGWLFRRTSCS